MSNAVDKATKLLALATSPNENEARNAAMKAAECIRKNGLVILAPDDPRLSGRGSARPSWDWSPPPRPEPPPRRPDPPPPPPKPKPEPVQDFPIRMTAKHPGFCRVCRKTFEAGVRIYWMKGVGTSHVDCGWPE